MNEKRLASKLAGLMGEPDDLVVGQADRLGKLAQDVARSRAAPPITSRSKCA